MPRLGILDVVGLAVTLALVAPLAVFGAGWLLDGRPLGAVFLAVAAGLLLAQHLLTTPEDLPAVVLERVVGRVADPPDDEE